MCIFSDCSLDEVIGSYMSFSQRRDIVNRYFRRWGWPWNGAHQPTLYPFGSHYRRMLADYLWIWNNNSLKSVNVLSLSNSRRRLLIFSLIGRFLSNLFLFQHWRLPSTAIRMPTLNKRKGFQVIEHACWGCYLFRWGLSGERSSVFAVIVRHGWFWVWGWSSVVSLIFIESGDGGGVTRAFLS